MLYANEHSRSNIFILDLISTPHRWNQTPRQKNHFTIWLSFYFSSFLPFRQADERRKRRVVRWEMCWLNCENLDFYFCCYPKSENNEQAEKNARKNDKNFNALLSRERRQIKKVCSCRTTFRAASWKRKEILINFDETQHNSEKCLVSLC